MNFRKSSNPRQKVDHICRFNLQKKCHARFVRNLGEVTDAPTLHKKAYSHVQTAPGVETLRAHGQPLTLVDALIELRKEVQEMKKQLAALDGVLLVTVHRAYLSLLSRI